MKTIPIQAGMHIMHLFIISHFSFLIHLKTEGRLNLPSAEQSQIISFPQRFQC